MIMMMTNNWLNFDVDDDGNDDMMMLILTVL